MSVSQLSTTAHPEREKAAKPHSIAVDLMFQRKMRISVIYLFVQKFGLVQKFNLTLNERDKDLPSVFFGRLLSFHFFAFFFLGGGGFFQAFFGGFMLNLKT